MVKNPPAKVGDERDMGSMLGSGRYLQEKIAAPSSILACEIPWTDESGGLKSMGSQRVRHDSIVI